NYNIQFAVLCENEEIMDIMGVKFHEYFTKFKDKNRPENYEVDVRGIGLPYPSNTYQLGVYQILFNEKENAFYIAQQYFSKLIFLGLKTEAFTEEDTHTLAVYAVITVGKIMFNFNKFVASNLFEKLQKAYFAHGFQIKENFPEAFNEINNLSMQLLATSDIEKEEPWLADWFRFCKNELKENLTNLSDSVQTERKMKEIYINKINHITNQLGIHQE